MVTFRRPQAGGPRHFGTAPLWGEAEFGQTGAARARKEGAGTTRPSVAPVAAVRTEVAHDLEVALLAIWRIRRRHARLRLSSSLCKLKSNGCDLPCILEYMQLLVFDLCLTPIAAAFRRAFVSFAAFYRTRNIFRRSRGVPKRIRVRVPNRASVQRSIFWMAASSCASAL